jgi:hypothetical protein
MNINSNLLQNYPKFITVQGTGIIDVWPCFLIQELYERQATQAKDHLERAVSDVHH